jgi:hypothetical protein
MPAQWVEFRHVPWTCQWGQFGGGMSLGLSGDEPQALGGGREWTPWKCPHPEVLPAGGYLRKGDCDHCPFWTPRIDRAAS